MSNDKSTTKKTGAKTRKINIDQLAREVLIYKAFGHDNKTIEDLTGLKTVTLKKWANEPENLQLKIALEQADASADGQVLNALFQAATIGFREPIKQVEEEFDDEGEVTKRKVTDKVVYTPPNIKAMQTWLQARVKEFKTSNSVTVDHRGSIPIVSMIPASKALEAENVGSDDD